MHDTFSFIRQQKLHSNTYVIEIVKQIWFYPKFISIDDS